MNKGGIRDGSRQLAWCVAAYLFAAIWLGGGGTPNPASEVVLQGIAVVLVLVFLALRPGFDDARRVPKEAWLIAGGVLVLPLVQLVPLPPSVWQALPGRAIEQDILTQIGAEGDWRPWTIAPARTLASFLAIIPPILLMIAVTILPTVYQRKLLLVVVLSGIAMAVLGTLQLATDDRAFRFYSETHLGWITGSFANRNAAVDFFLISSLAASAIFAQARFGARGVAGFVAVQGVLLAAALLTGSRAGILLLAVALPLHVAILAEAYPATRRRGFTVSIVLTLSLVFVIIIGWGRGGDILARFTGDGDLRSLLWCDAWQAMLAYWPWGSGIGTFQPAFLPYERLDAVDYSFPNRAHNDWLELLMEAGLFGIVLVSAILVLLIGSLRRAWQKAPLDRPILLLAAGSLLLMGLHSMVDYPFRTMALASIGALAAGLILSIGRREALAEGSDEEIGR
ncbi:hypothetical protein GRI38_07170 [Altererythrobacter aurantiacus]|uniref:O-antigen ligase-related domain-containing protein n=1 Tax=Parapontixanthobacter aurantiacus TaxID=1463599 RepID=A0A844ZB98_9SPHN|nr:O-antigen ligase family protein [Parapontixanthobacter aurantiacus]MXO85811.1 hypothetical protein [Parapontixanthobacter aurantiacus]